ncbi:response regulator receiver domain [Pantoea eucrina]|uniref:response regulator receiver domain n=1 Tax=Pantoea eucrina TaxID=472693 RepID=UPI0020266826|nr:response regulator receiver domain [Pantoea eucrina]MCL9647443.1 response regulator receiver domain [Pantoea eucrina]
MTIQNYQHLVNKTFCSNAIRSVMLIDDDFLTYSTSIDKILNGERIDDKKLDGSKRAAQLEKFFQTKHILCDIDDGSVNFDIDRIKKSDLIIIDYQLDNASPVKTLETLVKLKDSPQFNLIVVYTNEDLNRVWKEICTTFHNLKPAAKIITENDSYEFNSFCDEHLLPNIEKKGGYDLLDDEKINFLANKAIPNRIRCELFKDKRFTAVPELKAHIDAIIEVTISHSLENHKILQYNSNLKESDTIFGKCAGNKWIKSGNVFISLFNKSKELLDSEAEDIWGNLGNSIYEWKPSYYSIIKSEIQNKIEAEAFPFDDHLANDIFGQAAWLNEILKDNDSYNRKEKIDFVFKNIAEELYFKLRANTSLNEFINDVFKHFEGDFDLIKSGENHDQERLKFCAESMGLNYNEDCNNDMYHALNMNTSSRNYREKYPTTGTVLYDEATNEWYLCVSAACDMVPSQGGDSYHKRLKPHRLIQVLKLFNCSAENAITNASHSRYIYVYEKDAKPSRKYYSVVNPATNLPQIDYMVILNHTTQQEHRNVNVLVLSADADGIKPDPITLKLKSQLRTGYAERYQLLASQYGGRIGVDYFALK